MQKYLLSLLSLLIIVTANCAEQNLIFNGGAELGPKGWAGATFSEQNSFSGKYCFELKLKKARQTVAPWYMMKINPNKHYTFSGMFKSEGATPCKITILLVSYDKFMRGFGFYAINVRKGTETTLTAPVKADSTLLKIADGSKWLAAPYLGVAFNIDDSGQYQKLPCHNLSLVGIKSVNHIGNSWEVELNKPIKHSYPTGCKIRLQRSGPVNRTIVASQAISTKWTKLSFQFSGIRKLFDLPQKGKVKKLWPYTKYVGIKIIVRGTPGQSKLLFDDLVLTEK